MKATNLYTGPDGESHFRDIEVAFDSIENDMKIWKPVDVKEVIFRECEGPIPGNWHTAPRRQYLIMLEGEIELEVADGSKRRLGPGQILLAEDTTGHGHITRPSDKTSQIIMPLE